MVVVIQQKDRRLNSLIRKKGGSLFGNTLSRLLATLFRRNLSFTGGSQSVMCTQVCKCQIRVSKYQSVRSEYVETQRGFLQKVSQLRMIPLLKLGKPRPHTAGHTAPEKSPTLRCELQYHINPRRPTLQHWFCWKNSETLVLLEKCRNTIRISYLML